ncbi:hypothetical protein [Pseudomonas borbori]|uniref:Ribosomal protein L7/L12 C-terminal domain-containing protein n=1 Tax=Pseudomonas borbori TaxID=289003 RepID=A0A1I5WGI0_9PSED|nr:hypothetical protein [Pseudomonas borbori]SFQ18767.1 hypothetical protein SAMN05216190_13927 [Pseudomonas borbori]
MPAIEDPLPRDVLLALQEDRRTEAIVLLRMRKGISEDEAEARIDRYLEENPPTRLRGAGIIARSKLNALIWLGLIVMMALVYLLLVS